MADEEQVEMHLQHDEELGWKVIHFPHEYEDKQLLRMNKDALVHLVQQLNTNGKALEAACKSQDATIRKLKYELQETTDERQEWCERAGQLQTGMHALVHVIAGDVSVE